MRGIRRITLALFVAIVLLSTTADLASAVIPKNPPGGPAQPASPVPSLPPVVNAAGMPVWAVVAIAIGAAMVAVAATVLFDGYRHRGGHRRLGAAGA